MSLQPHELELLAPARTTDIARQAIVHGADAVYLGGPQFGARHNACNSVADIASLVGFAHQYHARVFVAMNTIFHDAELEAARSLIVELYNAGVDALIVQDMGLLELDLPPIQLHASTQCDIRSPEKARFLADSGFSQVVLARELSLAEVAAIHAQVGGRATLEYFVHGALCVAFSGQCNISHAETGRSANRGDCSQACRLPYTLTDAQGGVVAFEQHLLSMKDNNQSHNLKALVQAGVRSFKIEGRYKDMAYVKNITAHYRQLLDDLIDQDGGWKRASSGRCVHYFQPDPERNFHRGATDYFTQGRQADIGAFASPKFLGMPIGVVQAIHTHSVDIALEQPQDNTPTLNLHNGDGLAYLHKREVHGIHVNRVEPLSADLVRIHPKQASAQLPGLRPGLTLHRNRDHAWDAQLAGTSAERHIGLWWRLSDVISSEAATAGQPQLRLTATDEDGISAEVWHPGPLEAALQPERAAEQAKTQLLKLGGTCFEARGVEVAWQTAWFVPVGVMNGLRRRALEALMAARLAAWQRPPRQAAIEPPVPYPEQQLSFLANIYNEAAQRFYRRHGVTLMAAAFEAHQESGDVPLMITKHCLRFSFNLCPKQAKGVVGVQGQVKAEPMVLHHGDQHYTLHFDCKPCEMHVVGRIKPGVLASPPPSVVPIVFMKRNTP